MTEQTEPSAYLAHSTWGALGADAALRLYGSGMVPMAGESGRVDWVLYVPGAMLATDQIHLPRSLRKLLRKAPFDVTSDTAFTEVVDGCADPDRPGGWISPEIRETARALHRAGRAHSIECWDAAGLAGGLYGIALGGLFIGESMFTARSNAGKVAFAHLAGQLIAGGFVELDAQMPSTNMARYGARPLMSNSYQLRRAVAMNKPAAWPAAEAGRQALDRLIAPAG